MPGRRDEDPTPPPSFAPAPGRSRPGAEDARVVGRSPARPTPPRSARAVPPRTGAAQQGGAGGPAAPAARATPRPAGAPASFTPAGRRPAPPGAQDAAPSARRATPPRSAVPRAAAARPGQVRPAAGAGAPGTVPGAPRRRRRRPGLVALVVVVVLLAWPIGLLVWANGMLQHTPALSGAPGTPGTTYLLAGSDARGDDGGVAEDGTEGQRTDTILLLHAPANGPTAMISLPRDTFVEVPGHGPAKLNSAFAWGGAPLLVQTVEGLTGLTVDHYVEIGMGGVSHLVDAVGGVNLCYDGDVNDPDSGMVWTAGCHDVDGVTALAFARMRKADPQGDVGRALRQRQLISAVMGRISPGSLALRPGAQVALVDAGTGALTFDEDAGVLDVARLALAFRAANGADGITGTPPIASMDHRPGGIGSTVLLDPEQTPGFFTAIRDGSLPPGQVGGVPTS